MIFLPDVWSVMPTQPEHEENKEKYAQNLKEKLDPKPKEEEIPEVVLEEEKKAEEEKPKEEDAAALAESMVRDLFYGRLFSTA